MFASPGLHLIRYMVRFLRVASFFLPIAALCIMRAPVAAQGQPDSPTEIVITEPFKIGDQVFRPEDIIIGNKDGQPIVDQQKLAEVREAAARQMAAQFGLPLNSKFYPRILAAMNRDTGGSYSVASPEDTEHPKIVIKHLRSTAGIPLPGLEDLAPLKFPLSEEEIKKSIDEYIASIESQNPAAELETTPLPDCDYPKTEKVTPKFEASDERAPEFDFLFLAKGKEPLSPQELYGQDAAILIYEPGSSGAESIIAKEMGVNCLPTRFRFKDGTMYMHLGRDALKNYDRSPNGDVIVAKKPKDKNPTAKKKSKPN